MRPLSTLLLLSAVSFSGAVRADPYLINPQLSSIVLNWQMIGSGNYHARISGVNGKLTFSPTMIPAIRCRPRCRSIGWMPITGY